MERMTAKQAAFIAGLSQELGIGTYPADGIKHVLGKHPANDVDKRKASRIIKELLRQKAKNQERPPT